MKKEKIKKILAELNTEIISLFNDYDFKDEHLYLYETICRCLDGKFLNVKIDFEKSNFPNLTIGQGLSNIFNKIELKDKKTMINGELEKVIDAAREVLVDSSKWQPIETAPKDGTSILLHNNIIGLGIKGARAKACNNANTIIGYWQAQVKHWSDESNEEKGGWLSYVIVEMAINCIDTFEPTHWMPLPNPPKQEKEIV
jgi:hypothetical protein